MKHGCHSVSLLFAFFTVEGMKAVELQHMFREIDELKEQIHQDR